MIVATLLATTGAVVLATPLGIGSAMFAHYYAPRGLGQAYGKVIELLAGIPSVVYGMWGLVVLVPLIARWHPPGTSFLSAIIILTIMILPNIALEMSYAMGDHRSALFICGVVLMAMVIVLVGVAEWVSQGRIDVEAIRVVFPLDRWPVCRPDGILGRVADRGVGQ